MLLDLSLVTRSIITLIRTHVAESAVWKPLGFTAEVVPEPPDKLHLFGDNVIGMYLYHVGESARTKNVQAQGVPDEVRYAPMGLELYYVLRSHSAIEDGATYREQLLMGCAMKALHDYPVIDDTTRISSKPGLQIIDGGLVGRQNRFRIALHPVAPAEAVTYWTAGSAPIRLASYYQVSIAMLEPETPPTAAGRVLHYGIYSFVGGAPQLEESRSEVSFRAPGMPAATTIAVSPAQAAIGDELALRGAGLVGDGIGLELQAPGWADAVEVDAAWGATATTDAVHARVQATAAGRAILPGLYSARVRVKKQVGGREVFRASNVVPLLIAPRIDAAPGHAPYTTSPAGVFDLDGGLFDDPSFGPEAVEVFAGDQRLARHSGGAAAFGDGMFRVVSPVQLQVDLPAALPSGKAVPIRVIVRGVEGPPRWVTPP